MSLQHIAKQLETKGRGNDTELIHMSKREISGLQALAKAHGGSLTKNPETGLYEAGFLEQILPIVAAGAAMYFTAGAATPLLMSAGMGATSAGILAGAGAGALIGGGSAAIQGGDVGKGALMGGATGAIGGGLSAGLEGLSATPTGVEGAGAGAGINAAPGAAGPGISAGSAPVDPNLALGQSTQVGTKALSLNPSTGAPIDPLAAPPVPSGGYSGFTGGQATPGVGTPTSTLTPTANYVNSAAPGTSLTTPGIPTNGTNVTANAPTVNGPTTPMNAGDKILKQQADAVAAAKADPNSSWWSKQTPLEKAGYTTAGAGILAAMNPVQNATPTDDTSDDGAYLRRISPNFRAQEPIQPDPYYRARYPTYAADGGIMRLANGGPTGPVERMTQNAEGGATNMFPQSQQDRTNFATPTQMPASAEVTMNNQYAGVTMADGGIADLGGYSDGGRLLKGPGDGVSDNIPATIGGRQPARLADGEFVVPARIVSELGNGSTDAGAKRLYAMMDRVQAKRKKSMGKGKFAVNSRADKDLPA